jgi:hypothetical protein
MWRKERYKIWGKEVSSAHVIQQLMYATENEYQQNTFI